MSAIRARARGVGRAATAALVLVAVLASAGCSPSGASPEGSSAAASGAATASSTPTGGEQSAGPTAPAELPTQDAALSDPVEFDTGVTVAVDSVTTVDVTAETPGEVDGTASVVTVSVRNASDAEVDLASAVVTLTAGDDYGVPTTAGPSAPFAAPVAPGASATATYVFMLDPQGRDLVLTVNYAAGQPVVVFHGKAA